MNQPNPYAPPTARVADADPSAVATAETPFFAVSVPKLVLMSVCTFGLYELHWFYRNWASVRAREGSNIMPFWRAIFGVFFCYAMFRRVRDFDHPDAADANVDAGGLAAGWIILTLLVPLPDPYWLVTFLTFVFMVPVQKRINRINALVAPSHDPNDRFSGWNWLGLIAGGLWVVLVLAGMLLPTDPNAF